MDKHAYLVMPSYGPVYAGAARGFYRASKGEKFRTHLYYDQGSLLACNFNQCWCWVLNQALDGKPVNYFAMLHADIQVEDHWLDVLIDELEERNLDVLSVLVPIKDPHGLTSTALGDPGDPWQIASRITMREAYQLPETFTASDIGHPDKVLLINTGCWVCKFDPKWAKPPFHFEINDRIVWDEKRKRYLPQVEPEDWNISRRFHALGLKVGVTRKVAVAHRGEVNYVNTSPWGDWPHDREYADQSIFPQAQFAGVNGHLNGWKFPGDVDGWLTENEGRNLARLAKGKRVLEIGSYCGKSTICMAQTAKEVTVVDPFDGRGTPRPRNTLEEFDFNLKRYGVSVQIHGCGTIDEVGPIIDGEFDLVFIDGDHDAESVRNDLEWALKFLADDGTIAFHDYRQSGDEGVKQVVDEFIASEGELLGVHDSLAVCRPEMALT